MTRLSVALCRVRRAVAARLPLGIPAGITLASLLLATVMVACTTDSPTGLRPGMSAGTVLSPIGSAAVVLAVSVATPIDSVLAGPPAGRADALVVRWDASGRVLVLAAPSGDGRLPSSIPVRLFTRGPGAPTVSVVDVARADGSLGFADSVRVVW